MYLINDIQYFDHIRQKKAISAEPCTNCKSSFFVISSLHGVCLTYLLYNKLHSLKLLRTSRWPPRWQMTWDGDGICKLLGVHYHAIPLSWLMWPYVIHLWHNFNASLHPQRIVWKKYILLNKMGNLPPFLFTSITLPPWSISSMKT